MARKYLGEDNELWLKEGDYGKDRHGVWNVRPPGCHTGRIPDHEVKEHKDGTITVKPSIVLDDGEKKWHGFLIQGKWSEIKS